jgi:hypothetical protein
MYETENIHNHFKNRNEENERFQYEKGEEPFFNKFAERFISDIFFSIV